MNKKTSDQDHLNILRIIDSEKNSNQREMADNLGISLGKLNFCLNELKKKGYVKFKNFKKNKNKLNYMYILTPEGISKKTKLLISFMQRKMKEYDELKQEFEKTKDTN
jgi:EPS-associated MarR family transcriptional regulator